MLLTKWFTRLCQRTSAARDEDAARELRDHLDLEAEDLRQAGCTVQESEYGARRALGNSTFLREEIHAVWTSIGWDQLLQDARYALRTLVKTPGFTAVAFLSLALGIGANTAIFTFVNAAFLKPLPYPDAGRIVVLRQRPLRPLQGVPAVTPVHPRSFVPWQDRAQSFEALALVQPVPVTTEGPDGAEQVPGLWVSPGLFRALAVRPFLGQEFSSPSGLGRSEARQGQASEVILSHGYWQRRFGGDPAVIGKTIPAGSASVLVVGVMPAGFRVGSFSADVYTPMRIERSRPESVGSRSFLCIGRLRPGVTLESARAEMELIAAQVARDDPNEKEFGVIVTSFRDYLVGANRSTLFVLSGVVGLILLIVCGNLASLLLTRGMGRQSELAVRVALGAARWRIVQQLGVESLILSGLGGVFGLYLGWAGSRALAALSEEAVSFGQLSDVGLDGRVLAFTLALVVLTTVLFGLLPAWQVSQVDLQASVQSHGRGSLGGGRVRTRSLLVIAEVALAVVLLVGASLLLRSFSNLSDVHLGFRPGNVLTMRTLVMGSADSRANLAGAILERVRSLPAVRAAGTIQFLPLTGMTNQGAFHFIGQPLPADPMSMESDVSTVSGGYFAAIGMEVLRGRDFGPEDRLAGPRAALVNQAFVDQYSRDEDPLGRVILGDWSNPKPTGIVGVVNNIRHNGLAADPRPTIFLAQSQVPGYFTNLVVRTAMDPLAMAAAIRREVRQVDPRQPFTDVQPMTHYVSTQLARPRLFAAFVGAFAALALFLATIGLYGLLAYEVRQRTHEIGLRIALGAQPRDVVAATMWQGARLVAMGLALGTLTAVSLSSLVSKLLFGVRATDPLVYLTVAALFGTVALVATFVPARRAAVIDPLAALRHQ